MSLLRETTKVFMYILAAAILTLSQVYADSVCDKAFFDLESEAKGITLKKMMSYDDVYNFSLSLDLYKEKTKGVVCPVPMQTKIANYKVDIKSRRINTINKFIKLGIKEEAGKDLSAELDYLSGKSTRGQYEFAQTFKEEPIVEVKPQPKPEPDRRVEPIIIPPRVEPVIVTPRVEPPQPPRRTDPTCGEVLHQNGAVNLENVRNQDSVGWCYAYTAADMLSFKLDKKVSAVSVANPADIAADVARGTTPAGGIIEGSARNYLAKNRGVCLESDLPSSDFKFCTDQLYQDFLNYLIEIAGNGRFERELTSNQCLEKNLRQAFPNVSIPDVRSLVRANGSRKLIESLYQLQCRSIIPVNPEAFKMKTYNSFMISKDALVNHIDQQISGGVIGIGYDLKKMTGENLDGGHASLIVGRRVNQETGACEYLIRNSWGKNCSQKEDSQLSCHKNCDSKGCRYSGHFWVSRSRVKEAITDVNFF